LYGTLEYDLGSSTTLSVGATHQEIDSVIDQGLPTLADGSLPKVSRSTFVGADWNELAPDTTDIFAELEHYLNNGGQLKFAVRHVDRDMLYRVARGNSAINNAGNVSIQTGLYTWDRENWTVDAYANLPFQAFGRTHNLIAGADWRKQDELAKSTPFANTATGNVYDFNHAIPQPNFTFNSLTGTETEQSGVYSQLRLQALDAVSVILGGRLTWWESDTTNKVTNSSTKYDASHEFTPFAALVYDVSKQLSLYASYADIFQAQNKAKQSGEQIKPRTGKQYEAGIKGEFADGLLNTQLAVFRLQDENRALPDPSDSQFSVAAGEVRSQGWEFEVSGILAPGWDVSLGYTRVDTEYIKDNALEEQSFAPFTPRHSANVWTHYSFANGPLEGFSVGGGARAVSSFYNQSGVTKIVGDGYTIASAQIGYEFNSHWSANLTANNLFDKKYYEKVSTFGRQNFYGEPRSLTLAIKAALF
jgi:outer-membrane receptor for ferric coprogen and ferric-rhodotorulic acid